MHAHYSPLVTLSWDPLTHLCFHSPSKIASFQIEAYSDMLGLIIESYKSSESDTIQAITNNVKDAKARRNS